MAYDKALCKLKWMPDLHFLSEIQDDHRRHASELTRMLKRRGFLQDDRAGVVGAAMTFLTGVRSFLGRTSPSLASSG